MKEKYKLTKKGKTLDGSKLFNYNNLRMKMRFLFSLELRVLRKNRLRKKLMLKIDLLGLIGKIISSGHS
jgi:hypothetical protein